MNGNLWNRHLMNWIRKCEKVRLSSCRRDSVLFRDRSLFTGGGGGGEVHYIWGEGHYVLSSTLGRAIFRKNSLRGELQVFEIISIYHQSLNSEFS